MNILKRIIYISGFIMFSGYQIFADTCSVSDSGYGFDSDPIIVTVNDFTCAGGGVITGMTLDATIGDACGDWYDYYILVNDVAIDSGQCSQAGYDLTSYLPVTSVAIKSRDLDAVDDFIYLFLTVNITFTPGPGPANPLNFSAAALSSTEIDLSFNPNANNDNVVIVYNTSGTFSTPAGTPPSAGQPFAGGTLIYEGTGSFFQHTGLSGGVDYYYEAFSYDGADYSYGLESSASTYCDPVTVFPWSEGFENGGMLPGCWTLEYVSGNIPWTFGSGAPYNNPDTAHSGSYNGRFFAENYDGNTTLLVSPPLNLSIISNPVLSFWHTQASWGGDQDELRVYYKTTYDGTWTLINSQDYTGDIPSWAEETGIMLPNPSATYFIGFEGLASYGYGICLDDITVISVSIEWTGNLSTDWNTAGNWATEQVPGLQDAVTIPSSPAGSRFPVIANTVTGQCKVISVEPGATLTIQSGGALNVSNP